MISDLKITSEQKQASVPVTVFHVSGWLDGRSEAQLLEAARDAYEGGARHLVVEMSGLDTLTSAGIRAIHKVYQIFTPREDALKAVYFKLCSARPQIYNVLGITGFLHNIQMYETLDAALGSFGAA